MAARPFTALATIALAAAQSIPPGEIRSKTTPYEPPSQTTLRAEVRVVEVPVVVRDSRRHAVAGLTKDDFTLSDDGKKQTITAFAVQSAEASAASQNPPRFLALLFDNLHLDTGHLKPIKDAAERFVKTSLAPGDRVAIVTTAQSQKSIFTSDVEKLVGQIAAIAPTATRIAGEVAECPHLSPYEAYLIVNHFDGGQTLREKTLECSACHHLPPGDTCNESEVTGIAESVLQRTRSASTRTLTVIDSLVDGMAKAPGQRVVVLTSSGFFVGTMESDVDRLMDKARHGQVTINGLNAGGLRLDLSGSGAFEGLSALASGTGGAYYRNNDPEEGFRELAAAPETMYVLSFAPSVASDGKFHKLKVQLVSNKRGTVEARLGYTALPPQDAPVSKLDTAIAGSGTITGLPASFTWEQWTGRPAITMIARFDIGQLRFQAFEDRHTQQLTIVAVVLDSLGVFVAGKRSDLQLSLKDETFNGLSKNGFTAALTIPAPPGHYTVRAIAQDALDGKLVAASGEIEIK